MRILLLKTWVICHLQLNRSLCLSDDFVAVALCFLGTYSPRVQNLQNSTVNRKVQLRSKLLALCMFFFHRPKFQNMHYFACIFTITRLQTLLHSLLFLELYTSSHTSVGIMKNNVYQNLKFSCQ